MFGCICFLFDVLRIVCVVFFAYCLMFYWALFGVMLLLLFGFLFVVRLVSFLFCLVLDWFAFGFLCSLCLFFDRCLFRVIWLSVRFFVGVCVGCLCFCLFVDWCLFCFLFFVCLVSRWLYCGFRCVLFGFLSVSSWVI